MTSCADTIAEQIAAAFAKLTGSGMSIGDPNEIANAAVLLQKAARKNKTSAGDILATIRPMMEDSEDELKVATPTVKSIKPGSGAKW